MHCQPEAPRLSPARRACSPAPVLSVFAVVASLACCSAARAADGALDAVVVTGTREPEAIGRSSADIVVIDAKTIRSTTADSVEDLIRRVAGMQLARNGGPGQNSGFFVRGAGTNSTVVLIDGVRVGSATLGQAEFEALGLAQIERIEVLRGPASSLYGADAVGGVVQIFTGRGSGAPRAHGSAEVGGERSARADVGASGTFGAFDFAASLGRERSRGVSATAPEVAFGIFNPDRDGHARNAGSLQLGYTPAAGHRIGVRAFESRLDAQFDSTEFAPPAFVADASPDFRNRLVTRVVAADYRGSVSSAWTTTLLASRAIDDLTSGANLPSRFVTRRGQATWQNAIGLAPEQQIVLAYEHLDEEASADAFPTRQRRHNDGIVVGYSGRFGAHALQLDARHDDNSAYGDNTTGRAGYAIEIGRGWKLRALAGTTFRAATFNDLAFPGFGVPTVRPERGRSVEAGVSWQGDDASASVTLYRNRVRDLIGFQPDRSFCPADPAYDFGCAGNAQRARLQGATIAATKRRGSLELRANVDVLDATDADTGARLPRRAAHQESIAADYAAGRWLGGVAALFVGSRPDGGTVLGGYGVVDVRVAWQPLRTWRIEAKLNNALDHRVEPLLGYRGLGRQAWLGVRFDSAGF